MRLDESQPGGLRGQVIRGVSWKAVSQLVRQLARVVVLVVLAHELSPRDYGLAGEVLVFSSLVVIFADLALGSALIQRAELTKTDESTVFWTSAGTGLLFTLVCFASAGLVASFFNQPAVAPLLRVFSLSFIITSLGTIPYTLLERRMAFRSLELRNMSATLAGAVVGIGLAYSGAGAWAIIAQQLAVAAMSTALLWGFSRWRPSLRFSVDCLRSMGAFGANVFGTRLLFYVERNADNVLVGRVLGAASLGVYAVSYNLMLVPLEQVGGPIAEVLFPAFARLQNDHSRLATAWLRAVRLMGAVVIPSMLGLMVLAPDFIDVVLGKHWHQAAPVVQVLAWVGLHQSLQRFNSSVLQAIDQTGVLFRYAVISLVVNFCGFVVGLQWGVVGVAVAYAITSTLVAPFYLVTTTRAVGIPVGRFLTNLKGIAIAAAGAGAAMLLTRAWTLGAIDAAALRLMIGLVVGIAVYVPLCRWLAPEVIFEVAGVMPARLRSALRPRLAFLRPSDRSDAAVAG